VKDVVIKPCACLAVGLAIVAGSAFAQTPPVKCTEPRPEVCTQQFDPACGQTAGGEKRTASNACVACADKAVVSVTRGRCEAEK
jgi:hypothetical protein